MCCIKSYECVIWKILEGMLEKGMEKDRENKSAAICAYATPAWNVDDMSSMISKFH